MQFCTKCGTGIKDGSRFCPHCGAPVPAAAPAQEKAPVRPAQDAETAPAGTLAAAPAQTSAGTEAEVLDLTGVQNRDAPQEGRYKPLIVAGLLVSVAYGSITWLYRNIVDAYFYEPIIRHRPLWVLLTLALLYLPVVILGLCIMRGCKAAAKKPVRETEKTKEAFVAFLGYFTLLATLSTAISSAWCISEGGRLVRIFLWFFFVAFLFGLIILCYMCSNSFGKEALFAMLKACFLGILPGIPLGFLLVKFMVVTIIAIVVGVVALLQALGNGGFIFYHREN